MIKNIVIKLSIAVLFATPYLTAQDADPIEAARQAKLAAEKAAADAEAATGAAIEAAASRAAAAAREKVISDRKAEEARKIAEKEAQENAEIDAAAEAAAVEARRKLAAELGLEIEEVPDSTVEDELEALESKETVEETSPLSGLNFGLASSIGLASGEAFSNVPLGGTIVLTTPYGSKVGPIDLTLSLGAGFYTGKYEDEDFNPTFFGIGANAIVADFIFSETHLGLVGKGLGIRQFNGITLERVMKKALNLPFNLLIGGEGFISTDIDGTGVTTGWGGLGVRLDINL